MKQLSSASKRLRLSPGGSARRLESRVQWNGGAVGGSSHWSLHEPPIESGVKDYSASVSIPGLKPPDCLEARSPKVGKDGKALL